MRISLPECFTKIFLHTTFFLQGDHIEWLGCALYVAGQLSTMETVEGVQATGNNVSLTHILRSTKLRFATSVMIIMLMGYIIYHAMCTHIIATHEYRMSCVVDTFSENLLPSQQ